MCVCVCTHASSSRGVLFSRATFFAARFVRRLLLLLFLLVRVRAVFDATLL